jgi:hypothetical protein
MATEEEFWQALQAKVCVKCLDGDGQGNCRISADRFCAMKTFLPKILDAVDSVYSHSILPYEEQLRLKVCSACTKQTADGRCELRDEVECALDRYFPLIVEVIEETQKRPRTAGRP